MALQSFFALPLSLRPYFCRSNLLAFQFIPCKRFVFHAVVFNYLLHNLNKFYCDFGFCHMLSIEQCSGKKCNAVDKFALNLIRALCFVRAVARFGFFVVLDILNKYTHYAHTKFWCREAASSTSFCVCELVPSALNMPFIVATFSNELSSMHIFESISNKAHITLNNIWVWMKWSIWYVLDACNMFDMIL